MLHRSLTVWIPGRKELEVDNSFDIFFSVQGRRERKQQQMGLWGKLKILKIEEITKFLYGDGNDTVQEK